MNKTLYSKTKLLVFAILIVFMLAPIGWAATYYVDATNGRDTNSGLLTTTAWKTIAKVNTSRFNPGDQIFFKRGEMWREQLTVPSSGVSGNPITFGAYGTGMSPTINGSDQVIGVDADWTFVGGNVWRMPIGYLPPTAVIFNSSQIGRNDGILNTQYKWRYNAPYLEVFSVENPNSYYNSIEVTRRERAIYGWHKNYITIQDLTLTKAQHQGILDLGGSDWTIINVTVSYNHDEGIRLWGEDATNNINNAAIRNSTAEHNGDVGLYAGNYGAHGTIENNTVHHNCWSEAHDTNAGIKIWGPGLISFALLKNTSYGNGIASGVARGAGVWVDNTGGGHEIQYNLVHDNHFVGIYIEKESNANITAYNIVFNEDATLDAYHGCGIRVSDNVKKQKIFNNTVYNCRIGIAVFGTWPPVSNTCNDNQVINNIVYKTSARSLAAWAGGDNDGFYGSGNVYANNCFGIEFPSFIQWGTAKYYSSYDAWQIVYGSLANSIKMDPQLADPINQNFSLRNSSPCIDKGVYVGLSKDFYGKSVPRGSGVDPGAVESTGLSAPRNLRVP